MKADDLGREYEQRIYACRQPVSQGDANWEYLRYLKRMHEEVGDPLVFGFYMKRPRDAGLGLVFSFVRGELEPAELVAEVKEKVGCDYVGILQSAGLVGELPQPAHDEMTAEVHLELLKACIPLRGLDVKLKSTCRAVAVAASTIWFRYAEQLHALLGLPAVAELRKAVVKLSPLEDQVIASNDFSAYVMRDEGEREEYREILYGKAGKA